MNIRFHVIDSTTGQGIEGVHVYTQFNEDYTDANGYTYEMDFNLDAWVEVNFEHDSYQSKKLTVRGSTASGTVEQEVVLFPVGTGGSFSLIALALAAFFILILLFGGKK